MKSVMEYKNQQMEDVTFIWKSMIKGKIQCIQFWFQNVHQKGSEHVQATRICLMKINGDNAYKRKMWSRAYHLSFQDIRSWGATEDERTWHQCWHNFSISHLSKTCIKECHMKQCDDFLLKRNCKM